MRNGFESKELKMRESLKINRAVVFQRDWTKVLQ